MLSGESEKSKETRREKEKEKTERMVAADELETVVYGSRRVYH